MLKNGDRIFPTMLKAICQAKEKVKFLTYVFRTGNIAQEFNNALANKAEGDVEVFVILDSFVAAKIPKKCTEG